MHLIISTPATFHGGTNLLFTRLAARLHREHAVRLTVIDFPDGKSVEMLRNQGVPHEHIHYAVGEILRLPEADMLLINLLSAKIIGSRLLPAGGTKIMLWSTYPYDGFKYLPLSSLFNKGTVAGRRRVARFLHPFYSETLGRFFQEAAEHSALVFMDTENRVANESIFRIKLRDMLLPLLTEEPCRVRRAVPGRPCRVLWLGRLADFKWRPVCALIRTLAALREEWPDLVFEIVGDGAETDLVKTYAARYPGLPVRFHGHVSQDRLEELLVERADLVVGHGTSILESAKLGIPSLVVNGFYMDPDSGELRADWLHRTPVSYVGRVADTWAETGGHPIVGLLREWRNEAAGLGEDAVAHWRRNHSPATVAAKFMEYARDCSLDFAAWEALGARRIGSTGRLIEWAKSALFGRKY